MRNNYTDIHIHQDPQILVLGLENSTTFLMASAIPISSTVFPSVTIFHNPFFNGFSYCYPDGKTN